MPKKSSKLSLTTEGIILMVVLVIIAAIVLYLVLAPQIKNNKSRNATIKAHNKKIREHNKKIRKQIASKEKKSIRVL